MVLYHLWSDDKVPARCDNSTCTLGPGVKHYPDRDAAFAATHKIESEAGGLNASATVANLPRGYISEKGAEVPPGAYWLGDPCYAAGQLDAEWERWVDIASAASRGFIDPVHGASINGWPVVVANTLYGDGLFIGSNGFSYAVDSGCIGVTPKNLIDELKLDLSKLDTLGTWVSTPQATLLSVDNEGTITFGDISIPTGEES